MLKRVFAAKISACSKFVGGRHRQLSTSGLETLRSEVGRFNAATPIEAAATPPSVWFNDPLFHELDKEAIFKRSWLVAGRSDLVRSPGQYFSDHLYEEPILVVRDESEELKSFYNACRHHAAQLTETCETGCTDKFVCPYHGWTYSTSGRLIKATRLKGIQDFKAKNFGLNPIQIKQWGPTVLVNLNKTNDSFETPAFDHVRNCIENEIGPFDTEAESGLTWIRQVVYDMKCNWKVFVDNYLDGGYHVEILHKDLTTALDIDSYSTEVGEGYSIQRVGGAGHNDRLGKQAFYAYIFPNFMINRYGPWLDTNLVIPTGPTTSKVIYNYYLEKKYLDSLSSDPNEREKYIEESLKSSNQVQAEDTFICESVQRGLLSSGYDVGRYAPKVETADFNFHLRLANMYRSFLNLD